MRAARGRWYCDPATLTRPLLHNAIHGTATLGLYAVSAQGTSKWTCLDVDDPEGYVPLLHIVDRFDERDHLLLEQSRRGWHLWAFFRPPVP